MAPVLYALIFAACLCTVVHAVSWSCYIHSPMHTLPFLAFPPDSQQAASATSFPTTLATTRYTIDHFNLTFSLHSDEPTVSVGAFDAYGDGVGTARATAVMFQTPMNAFGVPYLPTRCDALFFKAGGQSRNYLNDFNLRLYADDGSDAHNPGQPVSTLCVATALGSCTTPGCRPAALCAVAPHGGLDAPAHVPSSVVPGARPVESLGELAPSQRVDELLGRHLAGLAAEVLATLRVQRRRLGWHRHFAGARPGRRRGRQHWRQPLHGTRARLGEVLWGHRLWGQRSCGRRVCRQHVQLGGRCAAALR